MAASNIQPLNRTLGMISVVLGVLGLALFWWAPFGMVLALAGLMFGAVGWIRSTHTGVVPAWAVVGTLFCLAVLALDLTIAAVGLEVLQITAFR
jgi:hypothetical protein